MDQFQTLSSQDWISFNNWKPEWTDEKNIVVNFIILKFVKK